MQILQNWVPKSQIPEWKHLSGDSMHYYDINHKWYHTSWIIFGHIQITYLVIE